MELKAVKISRNFMRQSGQSNFFVAVKETDFILTGCTLTEITGRSGSGKSTFLNMMAGLLAPTTGMVLLDGTDLYQMEDEQRSRLRNQHIGIIPQGQTGLSSLTVLENVKLPFLLYDDRDNMDQAALELMERVDILSLKDAYPNELSGGELRRLAIARALIRRPEILLADEPTGDLDDENTHVILRLLREYADEGGSVLLITHEREAAEYADRHFRMDNGVLTEI